MWQVIVRFRAGSLRCRQQRPLQTMATGPPGRGRSSMAWLAKRSKRPVGFSFRAILDINVIRYPTPPSSGQKPTATRPPDLVNPARQAGSDRHRGNPVANSPSRGYADDYVARSRGRRSRGDVLNPPGGLARSRALAAHIANCDMQQLPALERDMAQARCPCDCSPAAACMP